VYGFDGMTISADGNVIYGIPGSINDEVYESIYAFTSCNNWQNLTLLATFQTYCNGSNANANQLITNSDGSQDLIVLCSDGFGSGPYSVSRIRNVNAIVANQALSVDSCAPATPASDGNGGFNAGKSVGGAIGVLCAWFTFYCLIAYVSNKQAFLAIFGLSQKAAPVDASADARATEMSRMNSMSKH
jgi:hypothetical protein